MRGAFRSGLVSLSQSISWGSNDLDWFRNGQQSSGGVLKYPTLQFVNIFQLIKFTVNFQEHILSNIIRDRFVFLYVDR